MAQPWEPTLFPASERDQEPAGVDKDSAPEAKIALFYSLFVGREDVYARRWENSGTHKAGWSPAVVGGWANAKKPGREYEPLTPEVVGTHLAGGVHVGLYPLLRGDACRLLACDFDGAGWALDALAYLDAARAIGAEMHDRASNGGLVLVATGSFLGEGFDCPPLDTLFLAFPMAFKGRTVQYVGRVLRPTASKSRVEVHDYVDAEVPVLARMHTKRLVAYGSLGFRTEKRADVLVGSPLRLAPSITSP